MGLDWPQGTDPAGLTLLQTDNPGSGSIFAAGDIFAALDEGAPRTPEDMAQDLAYAQGSPVVADTAAPLAPIPEPAAAAALVQPTGDAAGGSSGDDGGSGNGAGEATPAQNRQWSAAGLLSGAIGPSGGLVVTGQTTAPATAVQVAAPQTDAVGASLDVTPGDPPPSIGSLYQAVASQPGSGLFAPVPDGTSPAQPVEPTPIELLALGGPPQIDNGVPALVLEPVSFPQSVVYVPEPASITLLGSGFAALRLLRRWRRR